MKNTHTFERRVASHDLVEMIEVSKRMACVKITSTHMQGDTVIKKHVQEGFAETGVIKNWPGNTTAPLNHQIFLGDPGMAEKFRLWGMPQHFLNDQGWGDKAWEQGISKTPYTDIMENPLRIGDALCFNVSDQTLSRLDGSFIPKPVCFDYIEARMDNGEFNLEQVADILAARNDIVFFVSTGYNKVKIMEAPITKDEDFKGIIKSIPSYNADDERGEYIEFSWRPADETFQAMQKAIGPKGGSFERFRYIYDNDLLGINVARKPKIEKSTLPAKRKAYR